MATLVAPMLEAGVARDRARAGVRIPARREGRRTMLRDGLPVGEQGQQVSGERLCRDSLSNGLAGVLSRGEALAKVATVSVGLQLYPL